MIKKIPIRKCIGCAEHKSKHEFIKILRSPKNEGPKVLTIVHGDSKKDGRGAYICKNSECLKKAKKSRRLERTFRGKIEDELYNQLEKAVESNK